MRLLYHIFFLTCSFFITVCAFGQQDDDIITKKDTTKIIVHAWQLNYLLNDTIACQLDTSIDNFHYFFDPIQKSGFSNISLCNVGSAYTNDIFIQRNTHSAFVFMQPYEVYFKNPYNNTYYTTNRPYSSIYYTYFPGNKDVSDQLAGAEFSVNLNPRLNIGFDMDFISSIGTYPNQKIKAASASIYSSFSYKRYLVFGNFIINKYDARENGGVYDIESSWQEDDALNLNVNLYRAKSLVRNKSFLIRQQFILSSDSSLQKRKKSTNIHHLFQYDWYDRTYKDSLDIEYGYGSSKYYDSQSFFYDTILDSKYTSDSSYYRRIVNQLELDVSIFNGLATSVFIRNEINKYSFHNMDTIYTDVDTSFKYQQSKEYDMFNTFVGANLCVYFRDYIRLDAHGSYGISGRVATDFLLSGVLKWQLQGDDSVAFIADAEIKKRKPDYFYETYRSNHFDWALSLNPIYDISISGRYEDKKRNLTLGVSNLILDNYIYLSYDSTEALTFQVQQYNKTIDLLTFYLYKKLKFWKIVFDNNIAYQKTSNEKILAIPSFVYRGALYWDKKWFIRFTDGRFRTQLGFTGYYTTRYYLRGYHPALAQFYVQDYVSGGNYPYIDAFLNFQLKRFRFTFKYENMTSLFIKQNYQTIINYPHNRSLIRFGFSWTFYD